MGDKTQKERGDYLSQNFGDLGAESFKKEGKCAQIAANVTAAKFIVSTNTFFITLAIYAPE